MSIREEGQRPRLTVVCGPGRTKQEFREECDVNNIVRRYVRDGFLSHVAKGVPQFVDVSEVGDFQQAIEQVRAAEKFFNGLPSAVRRRFGNDPARFVDEAGKLTREEMRELGLAELRRGDRPDRRKPAPPEGEAGVGTVSS